MITGTFKIISTTPFYARANLYFPGEKKPRDGIFRRDDFPFGVENGMRGKFTLRSPEDKLEKDGRIIFDVL
jgi:hypothetical protein